MTRNLDNKLNLREKSRLLIVELAEGITIAVPIKKELSNAMVVDIEDDGSFTAHWTENWNKEGDFSTELMKFDNDLVMDNGDLEARNERRIKNGLMPIK